MTSIFSLIVDKIKARLPRALPRTKESFDAWFSELTRIYALPDKSDYKQAVATCIMHLDQLESHKSMHYFARAIRKSMANQIAYNVIDAIRREDKKKLEEEKLAAALPQPSSESEENLLQDAPGDAKNTKESLSN